MSTTYEINEFDEVVPYISGRRCNNTLTWREATDLELSQRDEIKELNLKIEELEGLLEQEMVRFSKIKKLLLN